MGNTTKQHDAINHPAHYTVGKVEVIDLVEEMDFCSGNAIKCIARHKLKHQDVGGQIEDLQKAKWYIDRLINRYAQQLQGVTEPEEVAAPTLGQAIAENVGVFFQSIEQVKAEVEEKAEIEVEPQIETKIETEPTHTINVEETNRPKRQCGDSVCDREPPLGEKYCSRACANRVYQREWYRNKKGKNTHPTIIEKKKRQGQVLENHTLELAAMVSTSPPSLTLKESVETLPMLTLKQPLQTDSISTLTDNNDNLVLSEPVVEVVAESVVVEQPKAKPIDYSFKYRCVTCQQIFHTTEKQPTPARCNKPECMNRHKQEKLSTLSRTSKQIFEQYERNRVRNVE